MLLSGVTNMAEQAVAKRAVERAAVDELNYNDNLNDELDISWGGRVSRYLYNYSIHFPDDKSSNSDETESIYSLQSKATAVLMSESDLSTNCCASDCDCASSNNVYSEEFDVISTSNSSCDEYHFNLSDSSTTLDDNEVTKIITICDGTLLGSDNGYIPDDTDVQLSYSKKLELPPPAHFRKCVQCRKENPNPYFQYCHMCFSYRKEFFVSKPKPKLKKRFSKLNRFKTFNFLKDSQLFKISNLQQSDSMDIFQNEQNISTNIENTADNLCNNCLIMPKNGIFSHGKISHSCFCYPCAKEYIKKNDRCPICNVKVTNVNKVILV